MKGKIKFPLWFMAPYILHLFLSACGSGDNSSPANSTSSPSVETGSIQFNIAWQNTPISTYDSSTHAQLAELDCANSGISTVEAKIYDESNLLIASGEWNCSAHFGTIANVKAGSNRTLVILGKDSQGNNIFMGGPLVGITILPNQTYNAGTITANPYSITLVSPKKDESIVNCNFSFQWSAAPVAPVGKFEIQVDDSIDFSSPVITQKDLSTSSYTPASLNPGQYYWRVRTVDAFGNLSKWSDTGNFTVVNGIGLPPPSPAGVNATPGDGQVTISWNSVSGATSYNLYWSTSPGVSKASYTEKIFNGTISPLTHTGRINDTTYYYVVTAVNSCGESNESSQVSATPGRPPSAPTGVNATPGDEQVTISWNSVSGNTSYNLYWSTSSGVSKVSYTEKISNVTTPFTNTGKINGTPYYYVVTAVNNYGESSESSQVSATPGRPPSAPTGVNATPGDEQVTISWSVSGNTSYNLYWSTSSGVSKASYAEKISNVTTPFTNTGKSNGTPYYYVVTAVNNYGESSESSQVSATPGRPPSAPTGVNATAGDGQVTISWNSVSGATSYNLYWSTSSGVSKVSYAEKISNVTSPFTNTGKSNGTTYYYVVTAVDSFGESSESSEVSASPNH